MRLAAFVLAGAICVGCISSAPAPVMVARTVAINGRTIAVQITVQPEHRTLAQRYVDAAEAAVRGVEVWAPLNGPLRLEDPPFHGGRAAPGVIVLPRTPWWTTPQAMAPELAVVRAITAHAVAAVLDGRRLPAWFMNGLVEYRTRLIVMGLFSRDNLTPGYTMLEHRYFGGFVPQFTRIRLLLESDNEPLRSFRSRPSASPTGADAAAMAGKTVAVLLTLERWLGSPVLDSVITEFIDRHRGQSPTLADFMHLASDATGQDLSWLLVQAFGSPAVFDYGVADLSSDAAGGGGFETRVTIARFGDAVFSGRTAPRVGPYESGKSVSLVVTFADGEQVREVWDGRDTRKTYAYKSDARAVSAVVDADRLIALDMNRTNNGVTLAPFTASASVRWSARWMLWLEHALLTYASLL